MRNLKLSLSALTAIFAMSLSSAAGAMCAADGPGKNIAESFNKQWTEAVRHGDRNAVEALYSREALLMPPTDDTLYGAASIADYLLEHAGTDKLAGYSVDLVSCEDRGDTLHVAGVWSAREKDEEGNARDIGGNVLRVLRQRENGTWTTSYDIWN